MIDNLISLMVAYRGELVGVISILILITLSVWILWLGERNG